MSKLQEFIKTLRPNFQQVLRIAGEELATAGGIRSVPANLLADGDWSIWLEDEQGDRHNFLLYISVIEQEGRASSRTTPVKANRLGVLELKGHAQGSQLEFIEASDYIKQNYRGPIRDALLDTLDQALSGKATFDGTIERTADGVILRVLSKNPQVNAFDAELHLVFDE